MTQDCTAALIVAKPGPLRDGLRALMTATPQIEAVEEVEDISLALRVVFEHCPDLVVLDSDLANGEVWMTVRRTKARCPGVRCIVLANDVQQNQEAEAAGADAVLLKGFPAVRLIAIIVKLLPQEEAGKGQIPGQLASKETRPVASPETHQMTDASTHLLV